MAINAMVRLICRVRTNNPVSLVFLLIHDIDSRKTRFTVLFDGIINFPILPVAIDNLKITRESFNLIPERRLSKDKNLRLRALLSHTDNEINVEERTQAIHFNIPTDGKTEVGRGVKIDVRNNLVTHNVGELQQHLKIVAIAQMDSITFLFISTGIASTVAGKTFRARYNRWRGERRNRAHLRVELGNDDPVAIVVDVEISSHTAYPFFPL
jgi:hypothetical protein